MKEYAVTLRVEAKISAKNEEQAQERAQELADALTPNFLEHGVGKIIKTPSWVGDIEEQTVDDVVELEP